MLQGVEAHLKGRRTSAAPQLTSCGGNAPKMQCLLDSYVSRTSLYCYNYHCHISTLCLRRIYEAYYIVHTTGWLTVICDTFRFRGLGICVVLTYDDLQHSTHNGDHEIYLAIYLCNEEFVLMDVPMPFV